MIAPHPFIGRSSERVVIELPKLLADQDILVYSSPSRSVMTIRGTNLIGKLEEKYPGEWSKKILYLPSFMELKVVVKRGLTLKPFHIILLREEIQHITDDLPEKYRESYRKILQELDVSVPETMTIPRSIEYLTMVCARYILDVIKTHDASLPHVDFQGLTLEEKNQRGLTKSEVLIFHNYQNSAIDYLLIECQLLAVEKIRAIMANRRMKLLQILQRKSKKFRPQGLVGQRRRINFFRLRRI